MKTDQRTAWKRVAFVVLIITLVGTFVSNYARTSVGKGDFSALYRASAVAIETNSLNDPESLGYYPPSGRPVLMVMAVLPLQIAAGIWWASAVGLNGLCLYLLIAHLMPGKTREPWLLASVIFIAMLPWLVSDLSGGNISPLILSSFLISYFLYRKGWLWSSGLLLAIGITVKFLPVLMIFFYAIKRRWKMVAISLVATGAVGVLPGVLFFGFSDYTQSWKTWSQTALSRRTAQYMIVDGPGISYINQSLANVLLHTLHPINAGHGSQSLYVNLVDIPRPTILKIWYGVVLISAMAWLYLMLPRKNDPDAVELVHFGLVSLPMVWFSPHVMTYYMTLLMPAIALLMWFVVEKNALTGLVERNMKIFLALYAAGALSVASVYLRAYGSYQLTILVLAVALSVAAGWIRKSARTVDAERGDPNGKGLSKAEVFQA